MENKAYGGEHPPPYDTKTAPHGEPQPYPPPQQQPYPPPQQQPYPQAQGQPYPQPYPQPQGQPQGGYGYPMQPAQQSSNSVVVVAPQPQVMTSGAHVQDNMVISIVSIFFCCILGIVATIKASDSKEALRRGDIAKAERDSTSARKLALVAIVIGIVCAALSILSSVIIPIVAAASVSNTYDSYGD